MLDGPDVRQHDGVTPSCNPYTRWETSVRGTATYTIPKLDVLVSTVFQRRNGPERSANHAFTKDQVTWEAEQRRSRDAAVPGRRDGWPGRMLHAAGHHRHGDELYGQHAQSG